MRDVRTQQPELRAVVDAARSALGDTDHSAQFSLGEVTQEWSGPTTVNARLGRITLLLLAAPTLVWLPDVSQADISRTVTIKNNTSTPAMLTVMPKPGGAIDGSTSFTILPPPAGPGAARTCLVLVVIGTDQWAVLSRYL